MLRTHLRGNSDSGISSSSKDPLPSRTRSAPSHEKIPRRREKGFVSSAENDLAGYVFRSNAKLGKNKHEKTTQGDKERVCSGQLQYKVAVVVYVYTSVCIYKFSKMFDIAALACRVLAVLPAADGRP